MSNEIEVQNNEARSRYEVHADGHLAQLAYRLHGDTIVFTHTGVPPELEGRGIASALAKTALDNARAAGQKVVPQCPFVAAYIKRHQEYQDLVAS